MVIKPTNITNPLRVSYIIYIIYLLHVLVTLLASLMEVHYKGYITKLLNQSTSVRYKVLQYMVKIYIKI